MSFYCFTHAKYGDLSSFWWETFAERWKTVVWTESIFNPKHSFQMYPNWCRCSIRFILFNEYHVDDYNVLSDVARRHFCVKVIITFTKNFTCLFKCTIGVILVFVHCMNMCVYTVRMTSLVVCVPFSNWKIDSICFVKNSMTTNKYDLLENYSLALRS